ncbi:MAG TPA: hypothetical protein VFZ55_06270 [Nitrososphaera sp.]
MTLPKDFKERENGKEKEKEEEERRTIRYIKDRKEKVVEKTPKTPKQRFHKDMENAKGTIIVGLIVAVVGGVIIHGFFVLVGLAIIGVAVYQYRVAKRKHAAAIQQEEAEAKV